MKKTLRFAKKKNYYEVNRKIFSSTLKRSPWRSDTMSEYKLVRVRILLR